MSWIFLLTAALFEIGWPVGIKLSQVSNAKIPWLVAAFFSMLLSVFFLWLAQKEIPIGTAYAVWTGLGAAGVFTAGLLMFDESADLLRLLSVTFIVIGVVGLKLS